MFNEAKSAGLAGMANRIGLESGAKEGVQLVSQSGNLLGCSAINLLERIAKFCACHGKMRMNSGGNGEVYS